MSFILRNGLTSSAIGNLLTLLTLILPVGNLLPNTKYLFDKYFNEFRNGTQLRLYCPDCYRWLGKEENPWCEVCEISYSNKDLIKVHMQPFQILRTLIDISDKIKIVFTEFEYLFLFPRYLFSKLAKTLLFCFCDKKTERLNLHPGPYL